ncbi:MAG: PIN domain-containing protein [Deltaproteobacteria bacterium]|nr:MAG: PIN domain-containing protein [Deltaproteobacteria bacterium]
MGPVLADTSVWIDALKGKTAAIVSHMQLLLNEDRILICGPVLYEIKRGLCPAEREKILPLFDALTRLSFEENMWEAAGDLDASLRGKGITIPPMDVLIATLCLRHGVFLFTLDEHFHSVPGLKILPTA